MSTCGWSWVFQRIGISGTGRVAAKKEARQTVQNRQIRQISLQEADQTSIYNYKGREAKTCRSRVSTSYAFRDFETR